MGQQADSDSTHVQALLEQYVEERDQGGAPDPAELCRDSPDLLPALQRFIREYEELRGALAPSEQASFRPDPELHDEIASRAATEDVPEGLLAVGQVLGERYRILGMLGRGGIGEVWHAFDLKLRVEVALKVLRPELFKSGRRLELLRQEVRAAREVLSPNVCRIFDLIEIEGRELVSMEYVDGDTLLGVLHERGPLDLKEAQDIASQFLAGLEAIHEAGLVHRDIKPENIMLTRAGRVVVMDFGLARQEAEGSGSVSGTPAYMAPEQAAGQTLDARADVFAAGVVLAEMVSPSGIKSFESRRSIWEGVRSEPAKVPDSPWAPVIKKAIAKERERRFNTAHTLTRALEDVTLRVEGAEDLHPYPGLASFTEEDAAYFFGREAEVEQMWRKLEGPPRMLALVGPSGAGKSSFLRAGLIPAKTTDWISIVATPGSSPTKALANELVDRFSGDAEALRRMLDFDEPNVAVEMVREWRKGHDHAVLIVDQFEELFTQCPAEMQRRFADVLGRFVLEADVHVLLSIRDDFFFHCHQFQSLAPLQDGMTFIGPPVGGALRRALVQPATKCGYRFEDDDLGDEMLAEVEGELGALPLLAFAAARLWERRDRETGLLTREAYRDIGGVGGALAQHAEATMDRIGSDRIGIVRELFRNLVTAEGTRAVREWGELLSVFEDAQRESAEEVLRDVIDARLLTSYELEEEDREPTHRVEIIHESLLANWPRLVRWQTQDADSAQLRQQLRQAARTWDEQGRSDDTLWTGSAYREFASWRERYPGGLSDLEGAYATAMTSLAGRRRRRRRIVVAAVMAILITGLAVVGSFWRKSVQETRRAEAQKLLALGRLETEIDPSAAVAHAISSLELADTPEARLLALEALWKGPTALVATEDDSEMWRFSADGQWIVHLVEGSPAELRIIRADGSTTVLEHVHEARRVAVWDSPGADAIVSMDRSGRAARQHYVLWSAPDGRRLAEARYPEATGGRALGWNRQRALLLVVEGDHASLDALGLDGNRERLAAVAPDALYAMDYRTGRYLGAVVDDEVVVYEVGEHELSEPRRLGRHEGTIIRVDFDPMGAYLATTSKEGEIRLWDPAGASPPTILDEPAGILSDGFVDGGAFDRSLLAVESWDDKRSRLWLWSVSDRTPHLLRRLDIDEHGSGTTWNIDSAGRHLAYTRMDVERMRLWDLGAPAGAEPLLFGRTGTGQLTIPRFDPRGRWLATGAYAGLVLRPLSRPYASVMRHKSNLVYGLAFSPDGSWLASCDTQTISIWPLDGPTPPPGRTLLEASLLDYGILSIAASPDGKHLLASVGGKRITGGDLLLSLDGGPTKTLTGIRGQTSGVAISPDGRLAAGAGGMFDETENEIRVWDLESGDTFSVLEPELLYFRWSLQFTADKRLLSSGPEGLREWNVETGESVLLYQGNVLSFSASAGGGRVLLVESNAKDDNDNRPFRAVVLDLAAGVVRPLDSHGNDVRVVALDSTGTIAASTDSGGVIRVGPATGEAPHLLLGHEAKVVRIAFDPFGRWIASTAIDSTVRLWPMPDLSQPPLHTLSREELIAKLETLTNLRVVPDEKSPTGWALTHDPFPGWETVPTW